jgi:tRNA threonylcarbamoyladenosine biosynthesis protein TsaB
MLLGIDTCGSIGTVALAQREGDQIVVLASAELAGKTYAALLVPRIRALLEASEVSLPQIEAIVIVNGPGSFTGVRVGVSVVKGLAEALKTPVIAVSRLAVLAQNGQTPYAAFDAGRGEFYFGDYAGGHHEALVSVDELRAAASISTVAICEEKTAAAFPDALLVSQPTAADALATALPRLLKKDFDDLAALDGNYLRRSDAELFARPKPDALAGNTRNV